MITYKPIKYSKALAALLCLVMLCATATSALAQVQTTRRTPATTRFWTKQELLDAGFKFSSRYKPSYSNVIFGKKNSAGQLNGLVVCGPTGRQSIGYVVNGEFALPYLTAIYHDEYNYMSLQEENYSYNYSTYNPMAFIAEEIYGLSSDDKTLPARLCNGYYNYNYNTIASCFDEFIEKGKKIPENAWIGYPINIEGLILDNSNPYPRWLKSERVKVLNYIGPYNIKTWDRSNMVNMTDNYLEEKLPEDFDIRLFGMSFDYKPNSSNVTGGILRINRDFEICVDDGELVIRSELFHNKQWFTGYKLKADVWNHISLYNTCETLVLLTNGCSQLAAFHASIRQGIPTLISAEAYDQPIGTIKNVKIEYIP